MIINERIEELQTYIDNFPHSKLAPVFQKEINFLTAILSHESKEKIEYLKSLL